jgi:acyl carrier protein
MTEQQLREIICNKFLQGDLQFPINPDTHLVDEGICDSLGLVQLVNEIEKRDPRVRIDDQEITRENFGSIASILRFLDKKKSV